MVVHFVGDLSSDAWSHLVEFTVHYIGGEGAVGDSSKMPESQTSTWLEEATGIIYILSKWSSIFRL